MDNCIEGLVSIIIPTYNCENYICQSIDSCLQQTYRNIEIIVVDDGSTDNTRKILEKYISNNLIRYIYQNNSERSVARNNGIRESKGEFIQFLDSDDLLERTKIEKQVNYLNKYSEMTGVYCSTLYFKDDERNIIDRFFVEYDETLLNTLVWRNIIPTNSMLTRRCEVYFDENLIVLEDWDYWLRIAQSYKYFGFLEEDLCLVRVHENNTSRNKKRMLEGELIVLDRLDKELSDYKDIINYRKFQNLFLLNDKKYVDYLSIAVSKNKKFLLKGTKFILREKIYQLLRKDKYIYK